MEILLQPDCLIMAANPKKTTIENEKCQIHTCGRERRLPMKFVSVEMKIEFNNYWIDQFHFSFFTEKNSIFFFEYERVISFQKKIVEF